MSEETVEVNPYATQRNEKSAMSVEKFCDIETPDAIPPWESARREITVVCSLAAIALASWKVIGCRILFVLPNQPHPNRSMISLETHFRRYSANHSERGCVLPKISVGTELFARGELCISSFPFCSNSGSKNSDRI